MSSLHMSSPHMEVAGVEDEVVAFAVSVGLGDGEAEADGFEDEGEFGELSATFSGEVVAGGDGGEESGECGFGPWARRWGRRIRGRFRDIWAREKARAFGLRLCFYSIYLE
jgi:hypothetical protein